MPAAELFNFGVDVNLKKATGYRALHYAVWHGHIKAVKALVKNGVRTK